MGNKFARGRGQNGFTVHKTETSGIIFGSDGHIAATNGMIHGKTQQLPTTYGGVRGGKAVVKDATSDENKTPPPVGKPARPQP